MVMLVEARRSLSEKVARQSRRLGDVHKVVANLARHSVRMLWNLGRFQLSIIMIIQSLQAYIFHCVPNANDYEKILTHNKGSNPR